MLRKICSWRLMNWKCNMRYRQQSLCPIMLGCNMQSASHVSMEKRGSQELATHMRGPSSAVHRELAEVQIDWPMWDVFTVDGMEINSGSDCQRDAKKHLTTHVKNRQWKRLAEKEGIWELMEGVWFEPANTFHQAKCTTVCKNVHKADAEAWVTNGCARRKELKHFDCSLA